MRKAFQSTLPIQGETSLVTSGANSIPISIHSPYTGRDDYNAESRQDHRISIHSPYTGRDAEATEKNYAGWHFNPLSLYRERPYALLHDTASLTFQSTLPIQGETASRPGSSGSGKNFNPLSLYRERLTPSLRKKTHAKISIHSPYTGRDSNFAHKTPNIQPISYAKRQTKELFPTPTQQIITSLALISSISRCESPCIFMCTSHSH